MTCSTKAKGVDFTTLDGANIFVSKIMYWYWKNSLKSVARCYTLVLYALFSSTNTIHTKAQGKISLKRTVSMWVCADVFIVIAHGGFDSWNRNLLLSSFILRDKTKVLTQRSKAMNNLNSQSICFADMLLKTNMYYMV